MMVKATINHQTIADGISEALEAVRNDMLYWRRQMALHGKNAWMRRYILRLYVIIFEMYTDIFVEWSSTKWDRLKGNFDRSFFDKKVTSKRAEMKSLEHDLEREAELSTQIRTWEIPTRGEVQAMLQHFSHSLEERLGRSEQHLLAQLVLSPLFSATQSEDAPKARSATPMSFTDHAVKVNDFPAATQSSLSTNALKSLVLTSQSDLQERTLIGWMSQASNLTIDTTMYDTLQSWVHGDKNSCIWIEGPYDTSSPSENSLISAALIDVARRSTTKHLSYFCTEAAVPPSEPSFHSTALAKMVHSLIAQLVSLLPSETKQSISLSEAPGRALRSCTLSPFQAIEILRELMTLRPPVLICLIDGIQVLEDRGDAFRMARLAEVVNVLLSESTDAVKAVRVCFTTDGNSAVLADLVRDGGVTRIENDTAFEDTIGAEGVDMSML